MAPVENFANYPKAEEGPDTGYVQRVDHNPVLRGIPLVLGGELYARVISRMSLDVELIPECFPI